MMTAIDTLKKIHTSVTNSTFQGHISLLSGEGGKFIFLKEYSKYFDEFDFLLLEKWIKSREPFSDYTPLNYSNGAAGYNFVLYSLYKSNFLAYKDYETLHYNDTHLKDISLQLLKFGNYDFLHGSIGIAFSIISTQPTDEDYITSYVNELSTLQNNSKINMFNFYNIPKGEVEIDKVNLGFAHGIAGILKFLLECESKIDGSLTRTMSYNIIDFLLECASTENSSIGYFGDFYEVSVKHANKSRLAWCYGDLGIGFVLFCAGIAYDDVYVTERAIEILERTLLRKKLFDTGIVDAGFCHGIAGLAHIYGKIGKTINSSKFRTAAKYWFDILCSDSKIESNLEAINYTSFTKQSSYNHELLNGSVGIGLALLSHITQDFCWDECLMLNTNSH